MQQSRVDNLSRARIRPIVQYCRLELWPQFARAWREHGLVALLLALYVTAMFIVAGLHGATDKTRLHLYSTFYFKFFWLCFWLLVTKRSFYVMFFIRPKHPIAYVWRDVKGAYLTTDRLTNALPIFLLLPIFMSAFTSFKMLIPVVNPFCWDETFARWDAAVHGGVHPWRWLHPLLGRPLVTTVVNFFYNIWFFTMFVVMFWQMFTLRDLRLRMQFWLTFFLSWMLLGTAAAIAFSSAGPCFYGGVVDGEDIYAPLMEYLRSANESSPVWALEAQGLLWESYQDTEVGQVKGITAMPSMHMSIAFLFVLLGRRTHRVLGIAFAVFAALVMLGCVHLAWHYAIDAYVAILATWVLWWAVGRGQKALAERPR